MNYKLKLCSNTLGAQDSGKLLYMDTAVIACIVEQDRYEDYPETILIYVKHVNDPFHARLEDYQEYQRYLDGER